MSQQQRYDVSPKWAILTALGLVGMIGGVLLAAASLF